MKKIKKSFVLFMVMLSMAACNNRDENGSTDTSNTNSSKAVTDSTRGDKPSNMIAPQTAGTTATKESIDFATKAAGGGMMEVEAGKLAQQNAKSQRVKDFGNMMVGDHSKANDELKGLATANNITMPARLPDDLQKHIDMMSKMTGDTFDKHYMDMMVNDHKEDIGEFKKEANSSVNDAFKAFAAKTLPTLQKHLDSALAIHGK